MQFVPKNSIIRWLIEFFYKMVPFSHIGQFRLLQAATDGGCMESETGAF
jgi:hypothetical protein